MWRAAAVLFLVGSEAGRAGQARIADLLTVTDQVATMGETCRLELGRIKAGGCVESTEYVGGVCEVLEAAFEDLRATKQLLMTIPGGGARISFVKKETLAAQSRVENMAVTMMTCGAEWLSDFRAGHMKHPGAKLAAEYINALQWKWLQLHSRARLARGLPIRILDPLMEIPEDSADTGVSESALLATIEEDSDGERNDEASLTKRGRKRLASCGQRLPTIVEF